MYDDLDLGIARVKEMLRDAKEDDNYSFDGVDDYEWEISEYYYNVDRGIVEELERELAELEYRKKLRNSAD